MSDRRLIDADALRKQFNDDNFAGFIIQKVIDIQPTIDAVEVVRCKDCKHATAYGDLDGCERIRCNANENFYYIGNRLIPSCFCSFGERKTDNG